MIKTRYKATILGFVLAQGAPLGHIALYSGPSYMLNISFQEKLSKYFEIHFVTFLYIWIGTSLFFSFFSFLAGKEVEKSRALYDKVNKFMGIASHDLRSPISVIVNFVNLLIDNKPEDEKQLEVLQKVKVQGQYTLNLLDDFLDISNIEDGHLELKRKNYYLLPLLNDILDFNIVLASRKNIEVKVHSKISSDLRIALDKNRFTQVINNLVSNSIKYSPEKTEVWVRIESIDEKVVFKILDQGPGIPAQKIKTLFNAFEVAGSESTANEKSSGLGLYIVKKLINLHKGEVRYEENQYGGSTFIIELPNELVDEDKARTKSSSKDFMCIKPLNILYADDCKDSQILFKMLLKDYPFEITAASDGLEAVGLCEKNDYDLIFMDTQMPVLNGIEAIKRIKNKSESKIASNIISLTGVTNKELLKEIEELDIYGLMPKPLSKSRILELIKNHEESEFSS